MTTLPKFPINLFNHMIGLENLINLAVEDNYAIPQFPKYDILKTGDQYEVVVALAGYSRDEISIEKTDNFIIVSSATALKGIPEGTEYLHNGIAKRAFTFKVPIDASIELDDRGAYMDAGLLHIHLVRNKPESKKPKLIPIL